MSKMSSHGIEHHPSTASSDDDHYKGEVDVFASSDGTNHYRTVGWMRTSMIMLKMTFGLGVLAIPSAIHTLGAFTGVFFIFFWAILNTYSACLLGSFNAKHPSVHTVADAAYFGILLWRRNEKQAELAREICTWWFLLGWIMSSSGAILTFTVALNAISDHAVCSVAFGVVAALWMWLLACIPTLHSVGWIAWAGFASIMAAVATVTVAVGVAGRPAAAPPGPVDKALSAWPVADANFASAWSTCLAIYFAYANTPGFVPLIAEMREPKMFNKSVIWAMSFITVATIAFGLAIWYYCGQWVASPSLGSAGPTIKIAAYAIVLPALSATGCIFIHVGGKTLFVKFFRRSRHLTEKTLIHWTAWLGCNLAISIIGFIIAQVVPFFHELSALIASVGFSPLGICLPPLIWFAHNSSWYKDSTKKKLLGILHLGMLVTGLFITFAGSYAVIVEIIGKYARGDVTGVFSCGGSH